MNRHEEFEEKDQDGKNMTQGQGEEINGWVKVKLLFIVKESRVSKYFFIIKQRNYIDIEYLCKAI